MNALTLTLKNKTTNVLTDFVFSDGVYKLLPGSKDNFIENKIDKINFVPIENIFLLTIGNTVQSISSKQENYLKYLNLTDYDFTNYEINISVRVDGEQVCLFDSALLDLVIHSINVIDEYDNINGNDVPFGLSVVLYSIKNIKEVSNG